MLVLAHAGHWATSVAFALPVVLLPLGLGTVMLRDRRAARREELAR